MLDGEQDIVDNYCMNYIQGGCGIIAGWGARLNEKDESAVCLTAPNIYFPGRVSKCEDSWSVKGRKVSECEKASPIPEDFSKDCKVNSSS